jgi:hypothetical protein
MKHIHVFGGENFYARGGYSDFRGSFSESEVAIEFAKKLLADDEVDWFQVIDVANLEVVLTSDSTPHDSTFVSTELKDELVLADKVSMEFAGEIEVTTAGGRKIVVKKDHLTDCPECYQKSVRAKEMFEGGGVVCITSGCRYWFCY